MRTLGWFVVFAALTLTVAFAASIDGKWVGEVQGRGGPQPQTLTLKSSGSTVTGTVEGGRGGPVEISNGKLDGDNVSFDVVREFNGNSITQAYKGTVSGSELKMTITGGRGSMEVTYKKQ